ncbi:transferase hexapeptide repeat family protein [Salibacteraceae bacterium]|nr:transferase hexapeptide repeat family protein [Salibacteraceae bacterium]
MIYSFEGICPTVHPSSFVHPQACVLGRVSIGKNVYIGPFATIRADFGEIVIKDGCNVQESCTIHMFPGVQVILEENAHIGHGAIVHGAHIGANSLVGMNSVLMDEVEVGEECIIGALSMVPAGMVIPKRSLVVGNPAVIKKQVSDEMIKWKTEGTEIYQRLAGRMISGLEETEALRSKRTFEAPFKEDFGVWKKKD